MHREYPIFMWYRKSVDPLLQINDVVLAHVVDPLANNDLSSTTLQMDQSEAIAIPLETCSRPIRSRH